jgi:peptide/nickel transport system substrate-binding protein
MSTSEVPRGLRRRRPGSTWPPVALAALVAASLLALSAQLLGHGGQPAASPRIGVTQPLEPLSPLAAGTVWSRLVPSGAVQVPLLVAGMRDAAPAPALAAAWSIQDSARTLGLRLAPGFRWHDGPPVGPGDVAFSLAYLAGQGCHPFLNRFLARADSTGPESVTVRFRESVAVDALHWLVDTPVLPRHVWQGVARADTFRGARALVGCGPFRFAALRPGGREALLTRADSCPGPVRLGGLRLVRAVALDSLVAAVQAGELDAVATFGQPLPATLSAPLVASRGRLRVLCTPFAGVPVALVFDQRSRWGGTRAFRAAVASALDFGSLARAIATPLARQPAASLTPPIAFGAAPGGTWGGSPTGARAGLASLGLVDRDGDGYREDASGRAPELRVLASARTRAAAEQVSRALAGLELRARVQVVPAERLPVAAATGDFALVVTVIPATSAVLAGYPDLAQDGPFTHGSVRDPDYLRRVDRAVHAVDPASHRAALAALQAYNAEQLPALALAWDDLVVPVSDRRFVGWSASAAQGLPHWQLWAQLEPLPAPPGLRAPATAWVLLAGLLALLAVVWRSRRLARRFTADAARSPRGTEQPAR